MRTNQPVLPVGGKVAIGSHVLTRTSEHGVTFDFNGPVSPADSTNINAAIKPTGIKVERYWRVKDANGTPLPHVTANGQRVLAAGHVIVSSGVTTAATTTHPTVPPTTAPQAAPVAPPTVTAPTPQVRTAEPVLTEVEVVSVEDEAESEYIAEADTYNSHRYRPNLRMLDQWDASEEPSGCSPRRRSS